MIEFAWTLELAGTLAVLSGSTILWFSLWGRLTSLHLPRILHDLVEGGMVAAIVLFPFWLLGRVIWLGAPSADGVSEMPRLAGWSPYDQVCLLVLAYAVPNWLWQRWRYPTHDRQAKGRTHHVDRELPGVTLCNSRAAWAIRIPGNQILDLEVNEKQIRLPHLAESLEGLSIVHLSDFHFTGQIARPYFEFVVERANQMRGDLVAFTGDILDERACLDWFPAVFGQLEARYGVFAILGNHDQRMGNVDQIVRSLEATGVQYLGGQCRTIQVAEEPVLIAGNERPWLSAVDTRGVDQESGTSLRILLSHSPDQLEWARQHRFSLMLAGHTHGGQVRLPIVGPILAPSRHGTRFASGLFHEHPTWMHVSRGIGGKHPLRIGCRPELTRLILTRG